MKRTQFNPEMSEELALFLAMYALDSAFGRVLQSINLLASKNALSPELVQTSNAYIEAVHDHIKVQFRQKIGQKGLENFDEFSRNLREMNDQLIHQSLNEAFGPNISAAEA